MQLMDWTLLDALQAGALLALTVAYGADALARRDRMMGWLSITCLMVGLRHGSLALEADSTLRLDTLERAQSLLVCLGFIALCLAVVRLFPRQLSPRFPLWITLGMLPNFFRNLALPPLHPMDPPLHHLADITYLVGCGTLIWATLKARLEGDPMGRRLFLGLLGVALPVVVEIAAESLFNLKIRLSGFSLLILAMAIGTSWQWLVTESLRERLILAEAEAGAWEDMVPGGAFRTDRPSESMEALFGRNWADRIRDATEDRLTSLQGTVFRLRTHALPGDHRLGWVEREEDTRPGLGGFLAGWTVAVGMDGTAEASRVETWLRAWGADIEIWGTVPPREGPYPSVLVWAREPSILAVWREDDLLRRRARWVQVGGPQTEGPHARLEPPLTEAGLQAALEGLLGRR